jgi:VWFA-related protein
MMENPMPRVVPVFLLIAAALFAHSERRAGARSLADSQDRPAQQAPVFRAAANFVEVDVSVLDAARRPVRGLAPTEFTVLEDGTLQPVITFKEIDIPEPVEMPIAWMRDVAPDVKTNVAASEGRLMALILEDGIVGLDIYEKQIRAIGQRVVDEMGPNDLLAIIFTRDIKKSSDFSSDRTFLLSVLDKYSAGFSGQYGDRSMIEAVVKIADFLAEAPQRRKALFYVSPGWPIDFTDFNNPFGALLRLRLDEAFDRARRANVNIYPIDPSGLTEELVAGSSSNAAELPTGAPAAAGLGRSRGRSLAQDFLMVLANESGGRAIINRNEFDSGITEIFQENSSYYLLGYRSPNDRADGKLRKIEVRVDRPGVTVRARSGYYGQKPASAAAPPSLLADALSGILPKSEIAMQAAVAPFALASTDNKRSVVSVTLAMQQPAPEDPTLTTENVRLAVTAYNALGDRKGAQWYEAGLRLRPGVSPQLRYEVRTQLPLEPGRYQLRLAVSSDLVGRSGSIFYEIDVPDFSRLPLSMSGVVVSAAPPIPTPSNDNMKALVPISSTTRRQFSAVDTVTTFARVYQGGSRRPSTVTITSRVFDATGRAVFADTQTFAPAAFAATRGADHRLELPVHRFSPGPHVLTIEAVAGRGVTTRRDVRFEMR